MNNEFIISLDSDTMVTGGDNNRKSIAMSQPLKTGRPTKLTPSVVTKLEWAFKHGYNDTEACDYSRISRNSFYRWINEDGNFSDKIECAKAYPILLARKTVIAAMENGDVRTAKWYLERKAKDEFGTHNGNSSDNKPAEISAPGDMQEDRIEEIMSQAHIVADYLRKRDELREMRNGAVVRNNDDTYAHEGY